MSTTLTCSSCRHWHALPRPVMQTPHGPATDLESEIQGQCRHHLAVTLIPGPQGQLILSGYGQTQETFPACGQHEVRVGNNRVSKLLGGS